MLAVLMVMGTGGSLADARHVDHHRHEPLLQIIIPENMRLLAALHVGGLRKLTDIVFFLAYGSFGRGAQECA